MKKVIIFIILVIILSFAHELEWIRTYQNYRCIFNSASNFGYGLFETDSNEYIIYGTTSWIESSVPYINHDQFFFIKTDEFGDTIWTKTYCEMRYWYAPKLAIQGPSGDVFITEREVMNPLFLKINSETGDSLLAMHIAEHEDTSCIYSGDLTSDSCLIFVGYYLGSACYAIDSVFILKIDLDGETVWEKNYEMDLWPTFIKANPDGSILIGGANFSESSSRAYIMKFNNIGVLMWRTYIPTILPLQITEFDDSNFLFVGMTIIAGYSSVGVGKINISGDLLWSRYYEKPYSQDPVRIIKTFDNCFVITGQTGWNLEGVESPDGMFMKIDTLGNELFFNRVDFDGGSDIFWDIIQTSDSGFLCAGHASIHNSIDSSVIGTTLVFLTKFSPDGDIVWENNVKFPDDISLSVSPNPFNKECKLIINSSGNSELTIKIFDIAGNLVNTLIPHKLDDNNYIIKW
ncbi:hypothetical protein DRQ33_00605, partial [bacterium]